MKFTGSLANRGQQKILGLVILWIVYNKGGHTDSKSVLGEMDLILQNALEKSDLEPEFNSKGQIAYRRVYYHRVHAQATELRSEGLLFSDQGKSNWIITDKGRKRIETLNAGRPDPDSKITLAELTENLGFPDDDGNIPTPLVASSVRGSEQQTEIVVPTPVPEVDDPPPSNLLLPYFEKKGYKFSQFQIATFYSALKTKGFVILSGLSGTGKTKLAQHFGELFGDNCVWFESVRPDWRDSKNLLGFVNPLLDSKYQSTALLRFLLRARDNALGAELSSISPHFLILDEMNLAHVEYYFAEFLSVLESGRITQADVARHEGKVESDHRVGFTREAIHLHSSVAPAQDANGEAATTIPNSFRLPPNLYVIGTVNVDETTFAFSPKVLDRAFTIEFRDVDLNGYDPTEADESEANQIAEKIRAQVFANFTRGGNFIANTKVDVALALDEMGDQRIALQELNQVLAPYDLHFGYRVLDEIALFIASARAAQEAGIIEFANDDAILDAAVLMKVLPKIHGSRQKLEEPLTRVLRWTLKEKPGDSRIEVVLQSIDANNGQRSDIPSLLERWDTITDKFVYPETAKKVLRMLHTLYATGFASFA
ncbi:hypothetical protein ANRL3_00527 [Anaerolineae bacterium]|nr:hypothetical protein ANRL3_00527 [Anaerolineae bacterium]